MPRFRLLLLLCLLLTGCVTLRPEVGQSVDEWLSQWGPPNATGERSDGSRVLTWEEQYFGSFYQTFTCRKNVTAGQDGRILGYAELDCGRWL